MMTRSTEWRAAQIPDNEPQQIVATGEEGSDVWHCAFGTWEADDFGIDSEETVGEGERLFVNRRIYDALMARIAELEAANRGLVRLNEVTEKRYQERADAVLYLQALLDDCAEYLKDGETPRQRMDRDHHDVLSLMEMLAKDRAERDAGRVEIKRLRYGLECVHQYGSDTLMGPSQGVPDDRKWQRDGVLVMTRRARATLEGASEEEIVGIRADLAVPEAKINWRDNPDAIVEDDEPQIGRDYA
jgi:hypothetical protein